MLASVHAFLDQIIDYAGLFPPANLPLGEALRNYLHYKEASPHRWMLGRFVCPAAQLKDLLELAKTHAEAPLLKITALGQPSSTTEDFCRQLDTVSLSLQQFRSDWGSEDAVDMIEIALPKDAEIEHFANYLDHAEEALARAKLRGFVEIPLTAAWQQNVEEMARHLGHRTSRESRLGLKLRCGGVTAAAFPSDAQVAFFIARCRESEIPWKATAGLHHPRRHYNPALQLWHHGFLNVFGAGLLALAQPLSEADLVEILADRDAQSFHFDEERFNWKGWSCTTPQITEFRTTGPTSFGSCSVEEPCHDLIAMGLVE
jgi:hypothetical protein